MFGEVLTHPELLAISLRREKFWTPGGKRAPIAATEEMMANATHVAQCHTLGGADDPGRG
jgi:hypothetical protein